MEKVLLIERKCGRRWFTCWPNPIWTLSSLKELGKGMVPKETLTIIEKAIEPLGVGERTDELVLPTDPGGPATFRIKIVDDEERRGGHKWSRPYPPPPVILK